MAPLADVRAWVMTHKGIAAGGAAGAVALGLRARAKRKAAPASGTDQVTAAGPGNSAIYLGKGGTYDSTANDVYNSIQPQIDALAGGQSRLADALEKLTSSTAPPSSLPGSPTGAAPYETVLWRQSWWTGSPGPATFLGPARGGTAIGEGQMSPTELAKYTAPIPGTLTGGGSGRFAWNPTGAAYAAGKSAGNLYVQTSPGIFAPAPENYGATVPTYSRVT